ncbi:glycosyltransferase family 39 protein [Candidatus Gottesmanbacteria bacterium]|nr:glycosyltransferase family 39 protein [Candidatus Gottesmanbacteria bacterium]
MRFYHIGINSYWYDELYEITLAKHAPVELLSLRVYDPLKPPLFPVILSLWIGAFGSTETATRSCALVLNLLALSLFIFLVCMVIKQTIPRLLTIALYSMLWVNIWAAQQANYYSLLILLSVAALVLWQRAMQHSTTWRILLFAFVSALGAMTHYAFGIFIVAIFLTNWLFRSKRLSITYIFLTAIFLIPHILLRLTVYVSHVPTWLRVSTLHLLAKQFDSPAETPSRLFSILVYGAHPWLLAILGLFVLYLSCLVLQKKESTGAQKQHVLLAMMLIPISFVTPLTSVLNNWYYYNFLVPSFILLLGIIYSRLRAHYFLLCTFIIGIVGITNSYKLIQTIWATPVWNYKEIATYVVNRHIGRLAVDDCGTLWILKYYLSQHNYEIQSTCYKNLVYTDKPVNASNKTGYLGLETNGKFWHAAQAIITEEQNVSQDEIPYQAGDKGLLILKVYE